MKALLQKDLPWIAGLLVLGTAAMAIALCMQSFATTFVVSPGQRDELFHAAWGSGLLLGVVAFAFDEALGTREFLAQRPLGVAALVGARLAGCALVLLGWFVLVPPCAYAALAFGDSSWEFGHWRQWPAIWGTMTPAISACAIGAVATALPFAAWARGLCAAPLFLIPFSVIFWLERAGPSRTTAWPVFVGGHLLVAGLLVAWLWFTKGNRRDGDLPASGRLRIRIVAPLLGIATLLWAVLQMEVEANAVERLLRTYPRPLVHEGQVVLVRRADWDEPWQRVDAGHRPTGEQIRVRFESLVGPEVPRVHREFLRVEGPRSGAWQSSGVGVQGRFLLDEDGTAWWQPWRDGLRTVAKSPAEPRFAAGTRLLALGDGVMREVVLIEPEGQGVWRWLPGTTGCVRVPPPDGDRLVGSIPHGDRYEPLAEAAGAQLQAGETLLCGETFVYTLRDGELRRVGKVFPAGPEAGASPRFLAVDADVLGWTLAFDGDAAVAPFHHRFEPRTAAERGFALLALASAALRPPLLQGIAQVRAPGPGSWHWFTDPLVAGGRRPWLVGIGMALAGLLAWATRRRLRRLGAAADTIRFWTIAVCLLGPFGAVASVVGERPRAHARRPVPATVPPPRLRTAPGESC